MYCYDLTLCYPTGMQIRCMITGKIIGQNGNVLKTSDTCMLLIGIRTEDPCMGQGKNSNAFGLVIVYLSINPSTKNKVACSLNRGISSMKHDA